MPVVQGILETALYVKDVRVTGAFYRRIFGFGTLLDTERLLALNVADKNVLLLFKEGATGEAFAVPGGGGVIPGHAGAGPTHFAFGIGAEEVPAWKRHLAANDIVIEGTVNWPGGAVSLYFRDPDGTLVELITPGFWALGKQ